MDVLEAEYRLCKKPIISENEELKVDFNYKTTRKMKLTIMICILYWSMVTCPILSLARDELKGHKRNYFFLSCQQ